MFPWVILLVFALIAPAIIMSASNAQAVDLQAGGYGASETELAPESRLKLRSGYLADSETAGITLDFTPRASGSLFTTAEQVRPSPMAVSVGLHDHWDSDLRLDTVGLTSGHFGQQADHSSDTQSLAVGGALLIEDWRLSGGVGKAPLLGVDSDVMSAGISYGPMTARLVYGQVLKQDEQTDVVMFSTDLAAWSWLTLQSDVAISETDQQESTAVGRLGVRLQF